MEVKGPGQIGPAAETGTKIEIPVTTPEVVPTIPPSQEGPQVPVDGIRPGPPAGEAGPPAAEALPEAPLPPQEVQPPPPPAAETPAVAPETPPPEPAAPVPPPPAAGETSQQVNEALSGIPGALGSLEGSVAGQGQTPEQGQNIGEVAAADTEPDEIPTPEEAPEISTATPDAAPPVSPQSASEVLPPAPPQEAVPPTPAPPPEVSPTNPANPEAEDSKALVDEFLKIDFSAQVKVRAGIVDRSSFWRAIFLRDLQQSVINSRALGIPDQQILGIINESKNVLESNNRGVA